MVRKLFLTPPTLPEETQCRGLFIPSSKEWLAVFSQALLSVIYSYNYEQVNETDLTPEETAAQAFQIYEAWLSATCAGGSCLQPASRKVYRHSPTTQKIEYLEDEEWIEDETIPLTPVREEDTDGEKLCAAATNAVNVLRLVWEEGRALWDAEIAATDAYVDQSLAIGALIGTAFYPPILSIFALTQAGWEIVYGAYELLGTVTWDDLFNDILICLFKDHAVVIDGAVTFDVRGVMHDLWAQAFTGQAFLLMIGQIEYLVTSLGQQAIDAAGALTVVEGDCDHCGEWCAYWGPGNMQDEWTLFEGIEDEDGNLAWQYYSPAFDGAYRRIGLRLNDLNTADCVITEVGAFCYAPAGSTNKYLYMKATTGIAPSPAYQSFNWDAGTAARVTPWGLETTGGETDLEIRMTSNSEQAWKIVGIRVRGTGVNPFSSGAPC